MSPTWAEVGAGHLGLPEPPAALAEHLRDLGGARWGTRERAHAFRGIGWFLDEAETGRAEEYVLAGIEAIGTETTALHYFLVYGPVALFLQLPVTPEEQRLHGDPADHLRAAGEVTTGAVSAAASDRFVIGTRLVVVDSFVSDRRWALLGPEAEPEPWRTGGVLGARNWLRSLAPA